MDKEITFNEAQALEKLATEQWTREGKFLVSANAFSINAAQQLSEPLSRDTRDAIKLRSRPDTNGGALSNAKRLVLDANGAEKFFLSRQFALNVDEVERSPAAREI